MSDPQKLSKLSVEDYLAFEESASVRHEYVNGQIFAMPGVTSGHNIISINIVTALRSRLKGSACRVYMAEVKVRVEELNCFYYPDVVVDCGAFNKSSVQTQTPVAIFEVLSRSTASTDRREKLVAYQRLASLKHYVIVHQARKRVNVYRRDAGDVWTVQEIGSDENLVLEGCTDDAITISVEEIYADIDFADSPDLEVREEQEIYSW